MRKNVGSVGSATLILYSFHTGNEIEPICVLPVHIGLGARFMVILYIRQGIHIKIFPKGQSIVCISYETGTLYIWYYTTMGTCINNKMCKIQPCSNEKYRLGVRFVRQSLLHSQLKHSESEVGSGS